MNRERIMLIGHRGAMAREEENSYSAFEAGLRMGAGMLEMDARCSRDGKIVIMHDEMLERTSDGRGKVSGLNMKELGRLRLRNGEPIPTLENVLEKFGRRCILNIELKDKGSAEAAGEIVRRMKMLDTVLFSSFHSPWLVSLKLKCPKARVAVISKERGVDLVRIATSIGAEAIHPARKITSEALIAKAHAEGLKVNVWTVNWPWQAKKLIAWGADGIFTDKPDTIATLLAKINENSEQV
ncbi:MAG: glycerophosphodiester phosphodiesterase family protein [Thermoplasmata archaeon]|nr:glycerophosphodiester phosphodiesterase family protein [Thermoplasmata archaeon]